MGKSNPSDGENRLAMGFYNTPEQREPVELDVEGRIPPWVEGSLYRGAAGAYDVGTYSSEHWFDGFSRVHRFLISNGKVHYRSRNQADELMAFVKETGHLPGLMFAQDPCKMIFGALETTFRDGQQLSTFPSGRNVGVDWIQNWPALRTTDMETSSATSLVATTDANELLSLHPDTLEPLEAFSYHKYNDNYDPAGMSAAHPHRGADGSIYNYVLLPREDGGAEYQVFELNSAGRARTLATITDAPASYIHEVFGTEHYVILIIWQAHLDLEAVEKLGSVLDGMKPFSKEKDAYFYVINKDKGGVCASYAGEAFFAFHAINAYEDARDGSIVLDLPWMSDWAFLEAARMENLRTNVGRLNGRATHDLAGTFRRYRLSEVAIGGEGLRRVTVDFDLPFETCNIELPKLNDSYRSKEYRYAYGIHVTRRGFFADSLVKIDTQTRQSKIYRPDEDSICSEPIFVPAPDAADEDDGVLLSVVMDSSICKSSLVVIDAKEMKEIARARMPFAMGYGFHGTYAASA